MKPIRFVIASFALLLVSLPAQAVEIQRVVSDKGIVAWLVEDHTNPIISLDLAFRGGAALDPEGKEGLANMVSTLLDEGAADLDSEAFQRTLSENAISLRFSTSQDNFSGTLRTLTETQDLAFELLHKALTAPRFDEPAIERMRAQIQTIIRSNAENPRSIAGKALGGHFFPDHPYGRHTDGTPETVATLGAEDFKAFVAQRLARNNLLIAVVGDIASKDLAVLLDKTFADLPTEAASWDLPWQAPAAQGGLLVIDREIPQSVVRFGQEGIKRKDPDYYTAYVVMHILGAGGFSSRLYEEIREKRGLVYGVNSYLNPRRDSALVLGSAATANERVAETIGLIRAEWQRMAEAGPTETELQEAKQFLTGSFALRQSSSGSIAGMMIGIQLTELGTNYLNERNGFIDAVTIEDAKRVAQELLDSDALTFVVVGQPAGVTSTIKASQDDS